MNVFEFKIQSNSKFNVTNLENFRCSLVDTFNLFPKDLYKIQEFLEKTKQKEIIKKNHLENEIMVKRERS